MIHNSTYANILLQADQGGPYQINDYSKSYLHLNEAKVALGLANYDAVAAFNTRSGDMGSQTKKYVLKH